MSAQVYKNGRRAASGGSQSEVPQLNITPDGKYQIRGYQKFTLTRTTLKIENQYANKFNYFQKFLRDHKNECSSMSDIGASNGMVVFGAAQQGYTAWGLDHDRACVKLMERVKKDLEFTNVNVKEYSFGDKHIKTDIVIAGALIHWIFSCTSLNGTFDKISEYFAGITKKYLIIEWVAPGDSAIKFFKHTSHNKNIQKEEYNKINFITSLKKYFAQVEKVLQVTGSRELYLCTVAVDSITVQE